MLRIITADQRASGPRGVKALIVGPAGAGKTSLLRTLNTETTLFVDLEAGDLSVQDVPVDSVKPKTWEECRDIACLLGGPNHAFASTDPYSQAHFDSLSGVDASKYETLFVDSLTVASRICFRWCQQQPEAHNKAGKQDLLGAYGLLGREMIRWATQLQHAPKNVVMVGILEQTKDEFGTKSWDLQIEGSKAGRELPGIVDEVLTLNFIPFEEGSTPIRAFVCTQPNAWGYPAKDRSGKLEPFEKPDLGALISKITARQ